MGTFRLFANYFDTNINNLVRNYLSSYKVKSMIKVFDCSKYL